MLEGISVVAKHPRRIYCEQCGRSYTQKSHLVSHQRYQCGGKEPQFQCPQCPKRVGFNFLLRNNKTIGGLQGSLMAEVFSEMGKDPNRFYCEQCGRSYTQKSHLLCHQRYQCGGKEPQFQCPQCPKRCRIKSNLRRHMLVHLPRWQEAAAAIENVSEASQEQV
ncbi:hypothetical protein J6590_002389 [Homalodisca vitripennis]|nr:hypothetical protein J6590_002389 [Homalodisca vitripennis]